MKKQEDFFYVCVKDPVGLRRDLLLSSKALLDSLKTFELHYSIKAEKTKLFHDLKKVFDDILVLDRKLRSVLPKVKVPAAVVSPVDVESVKFEPVAVKRSKLDVLEDELSRVESKLSSLK
ncbi:hypothetical protein DRJ22_05890 [Candidatus Woesearchaeota archaeon]|nr:MAG: hypothetical protein B6U93_03275 [Candidatus Woesearchaeota archaeon ex4484_78]RLE44484.1 MAG: hypothetical protein DRJ22_05890 [Candidatus Woesearchaeota archaeon]